MSPCSDGAASSRSSNAVSVGDEKRAPIIAINGELDAKLAQRLTKIQGPFILHAYVLQ